MEEKKPEVKEPKKLTEQEIIFEGEYSNGIRWIGRKKGFNENGKLLYEKEYLNGKIWNGKGKEYYNDKLIFEGEYLNGERWNGKGKKF